MLVAYIKMEAADSVKHSHLVDEPFVKRYLYSYFPRAIVERFPEDTENPPTSQRHYRQADC